MLDFNPSKQLWEKEVERYNHYNYRYEDIRLNGRPVTWGRCDATYEQQGDALVASDGGARQPDRYLLNDADLGDFVLEWTMTRLPRQAARTVVNTSAASGSTWRVMTRTMCHQRWPASLTRPRTN